MRLRAGLVALALALALGVCLLSVSGARAAQVATAWRGANIHPLWASETTQQMHQDLDAAKQAGANVVRVDVAWATLDSAGPGKLTAWYSQRLSQVMTYANQLGLRVIAIAFTTPCWASSAPDSLKQGCQGDWWGRGVGWYPPSNDAQYGDFVRYLTSTYGNDLAAIEIWNEPDQSTYFVSAHPADDYAQLLKAAYPAAKAGNSNVPVLAGALSGADLAFARTLYADGAQGSYDGLSLHSYCDGSPSANDSGSVQYEFQSGLQAMHDLELQHNDASPLWVTEFGWSTMNVSPANQATWIQQGYQILAGMSYVRAGVVYELHDDIGGSSTDRESYFGMMNQDYSAKPAYGAWSAVMSAPGAPALVQPGDGGVANGSKPRLTFAAAPNSTVAVYVDGTFAGTAGADGSGTAAFTASQAVADGPHSVSAVDTDPYGNVGPASATAQVTVQPGAPAGSSGGSPVSGTPSQPTFTFSADPGMTVAVYVDGVLLGTSRADASGKASISVTQPLGYGSHTVYAVASDAFGTSGPASPTTTFTVAPSGGSTSGSSTSVTSAASPPPAPAIISPREGSTSDASVSVQVKGAAGDVATICVSGTSCVSATVHGDGLATATVAKLATGTHTVEATQHDGSGATGPASAVVSWRVSSSGSGAGSGGASGSAAGASPGAANPTAAAAGAPQHLVLRLGRIRGRVVRITCRARVGHITRCSVTLFLGRRKIGSGKVTLRPGRGRAVVRVRLSRLGARRLRGAKHGLAVRAKASATAAPRGVVSATWRGRLKVRS